jgi:Putative zinc-binding metallo-peptidase
MRIVPAATTCSNKAVDSRLERMTDQQLLRLRLRDLSLRIPGTRLEERLSRLYEELDARAIMLRPHVWLAEEWFTPDGVAGFAIPFYLASPRLIKLERTQMLEVEGANEDECMRILRHEAGHAISNAFRLHARREWNDVFGPYRTPYPGWYQPQPGSRDYVLNLDAWYAQAHPAEDFAETFAVWLKPGWRWRRQYERWGARRKLEYVDRLMTDIAGKRPPRRPRREVEPLNRIQKTLREHYARKRAYYSIDRPTSYDSNLYRIFSTETNHRSRPLASQFMRGITTEICKTVALGTGVHLYTISHILREMIERARELNLRVTIPETQAKKLVTVTLTMQTMQVLQKGYHRIPL